MPSSKVGRWALAGLSMTSAICLVVGLFVVPNVVRVDHLECRLDEVCAPPKTPGMLWEYLPLPLAYLTLAILCLVVLASLAIAGFTMVSRGWVPLWLRLAYLVGGIGLAGALAVDALPLLLGLLPGPGVLFVLAGLLLLALTYWRLRSMTSRAGAADGLAIGGGSES